VWASPTGKEEDVEVGLVYFGKRYLNTSLQRWVSADPLEVHSAGEADANLYAYVSGHALKNTDPLGLEEDSENLVSFESNQSLPSGEVGDQAGNQTHSEGTPVAQTPGRSAPEMAPPANSPVLGPAKKTDAQLEVERTDDVDRGLDAVASDPLMLPVVALVRAGRALVASDETRDFLGEDGRVITRTVPADPAEKATALAELTGGVVAGKLLRPVTRGKGPSAGPGGKQGGAGSGLAARGAANANKLNHIFGKAGHGLEGFVKAQGGREKAFEAIQAGANKALAEGKLVPGPNGVLPSGNAGHIIDVAGTQIRLIGGRVIDGVVEIGSASRMGLP
jgi:RHS repeat-associated protein